MAETANTTEISSINPGIAPKLTEWANEPSAAKLNEDLLASKPAHDAFMLKVDRWNNLTNVTGSAKPAKVKGRSQVQPKLVRRQAEWRYSALSEPFNSSEKMFDVSPTTFEDADSARQNELVLNWQFRSKLRRVKFIDNYVRAGVDEGSAVVRVGWHRITKTVEEEAPVWEYQVPSDAKQVEQLEAAMVLKDENPRAYKEDVDPAIQAACAFYVETGQVNVAVQVGTQTVQVEKVIENRPTLDLLNLKNVYFDPSCGEDIQKAGFTVISFETSQAELKKEPNRYKNLEHVNWEAAATIADPDHMPQSTDTNFNYADALRKRVVAYEYWGLYDIHNTGELVPIVATWIGSVIIRMELNPFPDQKHPLVVAAYMPIKRQALGEPDAELLEENQKILGAVTRGMIDLMGRSANAQQGFAKGFLDVMNRRKFEAGQDYEFNPTMPVALAHVEHKYPEIPQSAMLMLQLQNQEAEALTGVKAFSGGLSGNAYGDVAAGIKGILDAAAKREMAILRRLADGLVEIGKKIIAMNAVFLSEEEIIRVTNKKPVGMGHNGGPPLDAEDFVTVKREDLQSVAGEFDLKVDISTAEIDNNKAQDLAFMLQTMGNNMDFNMTKMILVEIARLKRMPELAHKIEAFEPKPDPMQQQLLQLQIQKETMEIQKLQSDIALNQAKAMELGAKAEKTVVDTVEQETGTEHARNMELAVAQGGANQDLEVTKALVKARKPEESRPDLEAAVGFNALTKARNAPV
jgi:hypothetical protein